jgi:hypothetical protein
VNAPPRRHWDECWLTLWVRDSCAGCRGEATRLLKVRCYVRGKLRLPFPVCERCFEQYQRLPTRDAADRFVLCLAEEMRRRQYPPRERKRA